MNIESNPDRIRLFVDELRSGRRQQCKGRLTNISPEGKSHCCLGVATEVAIDNGCEGITAVDGADSSHGLVSYLYDLMPGKPTWEGAVLPIPVQRWYGFTEDSPHLTTPIGAVNPVTLNDDYDWTFEQIATAFEVTFLGGTYPEDAVYWKGMPLYQAPDVPDEGE